MKCNESYRKEEDDHVKKYKVKYHITVNNEFNRNYYKKKNNEIIKICKCSINEIKQIKSKIINLFF